MIRRLPLFILIAATSLLAQSGSFDWHIPKPFPRPAVPAGNPMSWNFNGALRYDGGSSPHVVFENTGLYNIRGEFSYPAPNTGLYQYTNRREDIGKFRAPTLRNIAVTAPYMHDGSIPTLSEVIDHYAAGGRTISSGPYAGVGHDNPNKALNVRGFKLTEAEKRDLIAFLESLTDAEFLHNPGLSDPWKR